MSNGQSAMRSKLFWHLFPASICLANQFAMKWNQVAIVNVTVLTNRESVCWSDNLYGWHTARLSGRYCRRDLWGDPFVEKHSIFNETHPTSRKKTHKCGWDGFVTPQHGSRKSASLDERTEPTLELQSRWTDTDSTTWRKREGEYSAVRLCIVKVPHSRVCILLSHIAIVDHDPIRTGCSCKTHHVGGQNLNNGMVPVSTSNQPLLERCKTNTVILPIKWHKSGWGPLQEITC